jgi:hypothetical protein
MKTKPRRMDKFLGLKIKIQEIIDLIALKKYEEANFKLLDVNELLDELIDFADEDEDLIEISKYQILVSQLSKKDSRKD